MSNLGRLRQVSISLSPDEKGYLGKQCPVDECLGYFKVVPGTGLSGPIPCRCPYCGHSGDSRTFYTKEQITYARSVAMNKVIGAFRKDLKSMEFEHHPIGPFGVGISMKLRDSPMPSIKHYSEKELETEITCDHCTLRFAIYGVFAWCPDCGVHNSIQILLKNLEFAKRQLSLAEPLERDLADHLVGDALENVVAAFDGFGREICARKGEAIRFQNLTGAKHQVQDAFGFDFTDGLAPGEWERAYQAFQKRHLLAHKMGVVDDDYLQKTADPSAVSGRKIKIEPEEIKTLTGVIENLGRRLYRGLFQP